MPTQFGPTSVEAKILGAVLTDIGESIFIVPEENLAESVVDDVDTRCARMHGRTADDARSPTSTVPTSTTATDPSPTTTAAPAAFAAMEAQALVDDLIGAWKRGDRAAADAVAVPEVAESLFEYAYEDTGIAEEPPQPCEPADDGWVCTWYRSPDFFMFTVELVDGRALVTAVEYPDV